MPRSLARLLARSLATAADDTVRPPFGMVAYVQDAHDSLGLMRGLE